MSLSVRIVSAAQATVNQQLTTLNPIRPGETLEVYATSPITDTTVIQVGTKTIFTGVAPLETLATQGPLVPDHMIAKWRQPEQMGAQDLSISVTGTATDILLVKS
jgi:hypothetical protein